MQRHFVTFYSPGTIVAETTTREIDSWNVDDAVAMSRFIQERYGARPYGFRFSTRLAPRPISTARRSTGARCTTSGA